MTAFNWLTLFAGAALSVAPVVVHVIPAPYNAAASGLLALATGYFHLLQPAPSSNPPPNSQRGSARPILLAFIALALCWVAGCAAMKTVLCDFPLNSGSALCAAPAPTPVPPAPTPLPAPAMTPAN